MVNRLLKFHISININ